MAEYIQNNITIGEFLNSKEEIMVFGSGYDNIWELIENPEYKKRLKK